MHPFAHILKLVHFEVSSQHSVVVKPVFSHLYTNTWICVHLLVSTKLTSKARWFAQNIWPYCIFRSDAFLNQLSESILLQLSCSFSHLFTSHFSAIWQYWPLCFYENQCELWLSTCQTHHVMFLLRSCGCCPIQPASLQSHRSPGRGVCAV